MMTIERTVPSFAAGTQLALSESPVGIPLVVASISGAEADPISRRLADLGFLPGTPVVAVRRAPMGDPTIYQLRNYQLSLRRRETDRIIVEIRES